MVQNNKLLNINCMNALFTIQPEKVGLLVLDDNSIDWLLSVSPDIVCLADNQTTTPQTKEKEVVIEIGGGNSKISKKVKKNKLLSSDVC